MSICCIEGCTGPPQDNEFFFEFPTSRLLRKRWLDAINTSKVTIDSRICCKHFTKQDYEMVRGKMRLRSKVVPTLFGGQVTNDTESSQESTETAESNTNNQNNELTDIDNELTQNNEQHNNHVENDRNSTDNVRKSINNDINEKSGDESGKSGDRNGKSVDINEIGVDESGKGVDTNEKGVDTTDNNKTKDDVLEKTDFNENGEINSRKRSSDTNNEDKSKNKKTRFKITPKRVIRTPVDVSEDSVNSSDSVQSVPPQPDPKEDIEGILTHYYIENKKTERQVAAMTDALQQELQRIEEKQCDSVNSDPLVNNDPVFIELSVGQETGHPSPANDCLMVLESVQCEIDPSMILAAREEAGDNSCDKFDVDDDDDDDDDVTAVDTQKPDPISLLTSSDEDDVIIQEPKIDTVEVSSADTDEDDMPLLSLVKKKKKKNLLTKLLWGGSDYYCVKCRYTTLSAKEYTKHMNTHSNSKIIHICSECGYTTCSDLQLSRHKQKHKNDKRFKCDYCKYSAKHSMSLMYHMRTHKKNDMVRVETGVISSKKKYTCKHCDYVTRRSNDLKRHMKRKHLENDVDDEDYCP